ncbi:MAG: hypothetical protein AAF612_09775 [Planctomycetota bacterium]
MGWSNAQKAQLARACAAANLADQRPLILRQLGDRAVVNGRATSTSPRLTNADFERVMAIVEHYSGGQIQTTDKAGKHLYGYGHWERAAAEGTWRRQRHKIDELAQEVSVRHGWEYAAGVIAKAVGADAAADLDNADERQLARVIDALTQIKHRPPAAATRSKDAPLVEPTR